MIILSPFVRLLDVFSSVLNVLSRLFRAARTRRALLTLLATAPFAVVAEPLPVPCSACGPGAARFAPQGVATIKTIGNTMTVTQKPARAVLNWQSFDIARGKTANFKQPSSNAIALKQSPGGAEPDCLPPHAFFLLPIRSGFIHVRNCSMACGATAVKSTNAPSM